MKKLYLLSFAILSLHLSGCAGLLIGGVVAGGTAVATTLHDRRTPGTVIDDRSLKSQLLQSFSKDYDTKTYSHANVDVYNGVVLITGEATNKEVANRLVSIAQQTTNVKRVESDILIGRQSTILNRANDTAISAKVKAALTALETPNFDPTLVNVSTQRGNVYLMGIVTPVEAKAIAHQASLVKGVQSVTKVFEYIDSVQ